MSDYAQIHLSTLEDYTYVWIPLRKDSATEKCVRTVVPNLLFSTRVWFHGRQIFHGLRWGWGDDLGMIFLKSEQVDSLHAQ